MLLLFLTCFGTLSAKSYRFESNLEADLDGIKKVRIEVRNGSIEVETWKKDKVEVDIEERVNRVDRDEAKRIAEEAELTSRRDGSTLILEVDYGDLSRKEEGRYGCSVEIRLPERLALDLRTTNGSIEAEQMEDNITASTTNGSISLDGLAGDALVRTLNGSVKIGWVGGELDVATSNGALRLMGAGEGVLAHTSNGSISLEVDPESNFVMELETTNGRIVERLSNRKFEGVFSRRKNRLVGAYGSGGEATKVELRTTNGRITISEA